MILGLIVALCMMAMPVFALEDGDTSTPISDNGVVPIFREDNPSCTSLGYDLEFKIEPPDAGTYPVGSIGDITVTRDGEFFDWSSEFGIDAVIAKGGPNANSYVYDPPEESFGDSGLAAPSDCGTGTQQCGLSHISFCYDMEVVVTKTAETTFTRTWEWTIDKSVTPESWELFCGDSGTSLYTVSITKTGYTDSDWAVAGTITIHNPAQTAATITGVSDIVSPAIAASVVCPVSFPYSLAPGADLVCSYSTALPDATSRVNTATVTTSGSVGGGSDTADVVFGDPTTEVNAQINVDDTNGGSWIFGDSGSVSYSRTFDCCDDEGTTDNTATIVETGQSDSASVTVDCYELSVTKDADASFSRTCDWTLDKSVDWDSWVMYGGDTGTSEFTLDIDVECSDNDDFAVTGSIFVNNPAPIDATINSVSDVVSPDISADVDCEVDFPYTLVAGDTLECTYSADLPDSSSRTNTATATQQNYDYDEELEATEAGTTDYSGTANVVFGDPGFIENECVTLEDDKAGFGTPVLEQFCYDDVELPIERTYTTTYECDGDAGSWTNTATLVDDDTQEELASDQETVDVVCSVAAGAEKDADTSFTRTWTWTIDKESEELGPLVLAQGECYEVSYDVTVDATFVDSDCTVFGTITIDNNLDRDLEVTSVSDEVGGYDAIVDCYDDEVADVFPITIPEGESLVCTYSAEIDCADRDDVILNTATIATSYETVACYFDGSVVCDPTGFDELLSIDPTAEVDFSTATMTEIDECIDLTDTEFGDIFGGVTVCAGVDTLPATDTYSINWCVPDDFPCSDTPYDFENCADFVTTDEQVTDEDCWSIPYTVPCVGCTLTPGYWKTHSEFGPAPYDETWAQLPSGASTPFFLSEQTYYEVLWTAPAGNVYYNLAFHYIAAELNMLNGASSTPEVVAAFDEATTLFETYTPAQIAALKGKNGNALRAQFIELADILADYNEGLSGPGHCDESF